MGENKIKRYVDNDVGKISFNLSMYFGSPVKWSLQVIWSPSPLPRFTLFPVTSTFEELPLLPWRKNEIVFVNRPAFPFDECPTTTSHFSTATANFPSPFSGSNRALTNSPSVGFYFTM